MEGEIEVHVNEEVVMKSQLEEWILPAWHGSEKVTAKDHSIGLRSYGRARSNSRNMTQGTEPGLT